VGKRKPPGRKTNTVYLSVAIALAQTWKEGIWYSKGGFLPWGRKAERGERGGSYRLFSI